MENGILTTIVVAILGSGALSSMIQFFITLGFSRRDKSREIEKKLDALSEKVDENSAILARTHILRFSDEIKNGVIHSSEYWRQQLDDCDTYQKFCANHPGFKNSYTEAADEHIRETYKELMRAGKI